MGENKWTFMDQRTGVLQGTGDLRRESQPGNNTPIKGEGLCQSYKREISSFRMLKQQQEELQLYKFHQKEELIGKSRSERNCWKYGHVILNTIG